MSYTPTEWEPTDVVTATRMNALETAVGEMNMSYTPNTWSDGDILSAEKMNALEQAVASGGGGSSDFSTATVRVILQGGTTANVCLPLTHVLDGSFVCGFTGMDDETVTVYLKDGSVTCTVVGDFDSVNVSGNASVDEYYPDNVIITGDCTITIS